MKREDQDQILYKYTWLGDGKLPVGEIVSLLEENGYDGYLSLEWEKEWRPEIRDVYENPAELLADFNRFMDRLEQDNKAK